MPRMQVLSDPAAALRTKHRREFDGPIAHLKKFDETGIKSSLTWGTVPASYKILITVSIHLQHSFLQIVLYYVEGAYINRPARSKAVAEFCLLARPAKANPRSRPIRGR
jgi:hypothetical protein